MIFRTAIGGICWFPVFAYYTICTVLNLTVGDFSLQNFTLARPKETIQIDEIDEPSSLTTALGVSSVILRMGGSALIDLDHPFKVQWLDLNLNIEISWYDEWISFFLATITKFLAKSFDVIPKQDPSFWL